MTMTMTSSDHSTFFRGKGFFGMFYIQWHCLAKGIYGINRLWLYDYDCDYDHDYDYD
jgi:hypothetical protein